MGAGQSAIVRHNWWAWAAEPDVDSLIGMPTPWLDTGGFFMWWRLAFDTATTPTDAAADSRLTVRADLTPRRTLAGPDPPAVVADCLHPGSG